MTAKSIGRGDIRTSTVSSASVGFALLATVSNAVILIHLLPTHGLLGTVGASLCVICAYFWWTVTATRLDCLRGFEDVFKLFSVLIICEVVRAILSRLLALNAESVWAYLTAALLLMPFLNTLVNLSLLPGLLLALTLSVGRLSFLHSNLPLSTAASACTALALGFLTTTATWLVVKREEKMETVIDFGAVSSTDESSSKSTMKRRRLSTLLGHKGKATVRGGVDMTTVIEAHGLLVKTIEEAPVDLKERLKVIANILASQAPAMDVSSSLRPPVVTSLSTLRATEEENEDEEDADDNTSCHSFPFGAHGRHRKSAFTTVTDSMGLPKWDAQPTELRSRTSSLQLLRRHHGSIELQKVSSWEGSPVAVDEQRQPLLSVPDLPSRARSQSVDYSMLVFGRELPAISEIDGDSSKKHLAAPRASERAASVGPQEKVRTLERREVECDMVTKPPEPACELLNSVVEWDFEVFQLADIDPDRVLSYMAHHVFSLCDFFDMFHLPNMEFYNYFRSLEDGYHQANPYHNRIHAADVLHACHHLVTSKVPGFAHCLPTTPTGGDSDQDSGVSSSTVRSRSSNNSPHESRSNTPDGDKDSSPLFVAFPPLEVLALYMAAAMHDYDHPGRTNAFLVETSHHLAVLYNDLSVLENHHVASAWQLLVSSPQFNFLRHLEPAEFKRLRFLVVQLVLATDLKKHFDILATFNSKMDPVDGCCIDWTAEQDRLLVLQMIIKMADISSPTKKYDIQIQWTKAIEEEFYRQGDDEKKLDMPVEMFMDRVRPQLAKLQVGFIRNLVAPLFNGYAAAGLLPGCLEPCREEADGEEAVAGQQVVGDSQSTPGTKFVSPILTNLQTNFNLWQSLVQEELDSEKEKDTETITQADKQDEVDRKDEPSSNSAVREERETAVTVTASSWESSVDDTEDLVSAPVDKLKNSGHLVETNVD